MSRRSVASLVTSGVVLVTAAPIAAGSPALVSGWPVQGVAGGPVLAGPSGGIADVMVASPQHGAVARRLDGRVVWKNFDAEGCGNCGEFSPPIRRRLDGSYGPFGAPEPDGPAAISWDLDPRGRKIQSCVGPVFGDRTCVETKNEFEFVGGEPSGGATIYSRKNGQRLWEHVEEGFGNFPFDQDDPPDLVTVSDGTGLVYTAIQGQGGGRVIALDAATGAFRWRLSGGDPEMLAPLASGVLVFKGGSIVALNDKGTTRWSRPLPRRARPTPYATIVDPSRGNVYLGLPGSGPLLALDAATGQVKWRVSAAERPAPLSHGRTGRLYVATARRGLHALQAFNPAGRKLWRYSTAQPVGGAVEVSRGRVALKAEGDGVDSDSLLYLINPRRSARLPRRTTFTLLPSRRIRPCEWGVIRDKACGVLKMTLRAPRRLELRWRRPKRPPAGAVDVFAPRGTSYVRLFLHNGPTTRGRHVLEIRSTKGRVIKRITFRNI